MRAKDLHNEKYEGYVAADDANGSGKFKIDNIINSIAPVFVQNSTTTVAGQAYMYKDLLYVAKEAYQGVWDADKFESVNLSVFAISKILESYDKSRYENVQESELVRPLNLIDKTKLSALGEWCNYNSGVIESTQYVTTYKHTPYIKIKPNTYYSRWNKSDSRVAGLAFFDSNFNFISGSNSSVVVQSPATAAYVIVNINTSFESEDNALLLEGNKTLNQLHPIPYEKDLEASGKIGPKYFDGIDVDKNFVVRATNNLIDKDKFSELGEWCNRSNGVFESTQYVTTYRHTPFIGVKPSTYYSRRSGTGSASVVFFGKTYEYLGYSTSDKFQTPADCGYIIVNVNTADESANEAVLFEGNVTINKDSYIFPAPPISYDFAKPNPNLLSKSKLDFDMDDDFVVLGKNLINKSKFSELGEWCNYTNGKIESTQYVTAYRHTPPIRVKPSSYYSVRQDRGGSGTCFFDEYGTFISGVTTAIFQTPANCKYLIRNINTNNETVDDALLVEGQETISKHGYLYPAPPYYYDFKYPKPMVPERDYVTVGASGADFTSVGEAFTYAIAHDKWVKILPGVYDLVAEGISGVGYLLPKKVEGYGAKLVCNLDEEDWALSPLNTHSGYDTIEVYGLEVECDNCRYTIHDDPGNTKPYHHVFKDLILTHKSVVTEVILAPDNIGGGFGNGGNIEIINCKMNAAGPRNFAWHSRTTQQDYAGVVECHGCVLNKYAGIANGGSWTGLFNVLYISDCLCGSLPSSQTPVNAKLVSWNNTTGA